VDFGTVGTVATSNTPREIALCLSYYAGQNTKRYRGRLYIPHAWLTGAGGATPGGATMRPTATHMAKAAEFATVLTPARLNGNNWCVASTVDKVGRDVTNAWVDDEWDVIRSRGLRGTTRTLVTVP